MGRLGQDSMSHLSLTVLSFSHKWTSRRPVLGFDATLSIALPLLHRIALDWKKRFENEFAGIGLEDMVRK